jgi:hypothetical protein
MTCLSSFCTRRLHVHSTLSLHLQWLLSFYACEPGWAGVCTDWGVGAGMALPSYWSTWTVRVDSRKTIEYYGDDNDALM